MAKNIDIHLKTHGAQQTKQQLDGVAQGAQRTGGSVEKMGAKAKTGSGWIKTALGHLVGPLGFAAIAAVVARAAVKVAKFFDDVKRRSDEAVKDVQNIRAAYLDLFEALDAFEEKQRRAVTMATNRLLQETRVSQEIGIPVVNAYTRQFAGAVEAGQITQEQYNQGLKGMLGYAERHGGEATADLVTLMRGLGMMTPEQQGAFRRQIAAGASASGLTDAELIAALGRGMPTIKAMGWTPEQAVGIVATLAMGETGRKRASLPATTLQGLLVPQLSNVEKLGISAEIAQDPQKLLAQLTTMQGTMDQKAFTQMLTQIYGAEAAAGVFKLITTPRRGITTALTQAAGAAGAAAEVAEEAASRGTLERRDAAAKAAARAVELELSIAESYMEDVREIGMAKQKRLGITEPGRQAVREFFTIGAAAEAEEAAFRGWYDSLTFEEKRQILSEYPSPTVEPRGGLTQMERFANIWRKMPPGQKYEELVGGSIISNVHYDHSTHYYPVVGGKEERDIGPRNPDRIVR